jgi:hypothetical protein
MERSAFEGLSLLAQCRLLGMGKREYEAALAAHKPGRDTGRAMSQENVEIVRPNL